MFYTPSEVVQYRSIMGKPRVYETQYSAETGVSKWQGKAHMLISTNVFEPNIFVQGKTICF